jgi:predicted protein tyrosine phosphatase
VLGLRRLFADWKRADADSVGLEHDDAALGEVGSPLAACNP